MICFTRKPRRVEALSIGRGGLRLYHESLQQHVLPANQQDRGGLIPLPLFEWKMELKPMDKLSTAVWKRKKKGI
jgi:hypothetical protein